MVSRGSDRVALLACVRHAHVDAAERVRRHDAASRTYGGEACEGLLHREPQEGAVAIELRSQASHLEDIISALRKQAKGGRS